MALPRRVLRGTYFVTRRCMLRKLLLRPSEEVEQAFSYCLALAAERFGILIHCFTLLSNHYHIILTDRRHELPRFMHSLNLQVAKALNVAYRRGENLFSPGSYSRVELVTPDAILEKMVYTINNPVAAGLVATPAEWPGLRTLPEDVGTRTIVATRPRWYFAQPTDDDDPAEPTACASAAPPRRRRTDRQPLPERVSVAITVPPGFEDLSEARFRAYLASQVEDDLANIRALRAQEGKTSWLGAAAVLHQDRESSPGPSTPDGSIDPRVACRDKWRRIERLCDVSSFTSDHAEARLRFRDGERDVPFPAGTWAMRVHFGAVCHPA